MEIKNDQSDPKEIKAKNYRQIKSVNIMDVPSQEKLSESKDELSVSQL